ncbi:MAG: hypothetical protein CML29_10930 [Rhizobiales bacterium]|nr:hypothetical protein [Hyphomicrobiales bacterium]MBA70213.1 hypothetical protein [Hyphomicrobiales bacterium]
MASAQCPPVDKRNPARALNRVSKLVTRHFDRKLASVGVNVAYLAVLGPLSVLPSMSQKELAASTGSSQAAMAELLARMVREEFLRRDQDPSDKRQALFSLAPKGSAVMPQIRRVIDAGNSEVFASIGEEGLESLLTLLARIEAGSESW